jgi:addiction module HigA family antidote
VHVTFPFGRDRPLTSNYRDNAPAPGNPALRRDQAAAAPAPEPATDTFPVHPGLTVAAELAARQLSAHALALRLRVPANRITAIVNGRRAITPETALRFARFFGNPPEFWLDLQTRYDLAVARREHGAEIERDVGPA